MTTMIWNMALFKAGLRNGIAFIAKHSPKILMALGISGFVASTVSAVKATPEAIELKKEAEKEKGEKLTKTEIVKACWKPYWKSGLLILASAGCCCGALGVQVGRAALLASACATAEQRLAEHVQKTIDIAGSDTEQEIQKAIAKDHLIIRKDELTKLKTDAEKFPCYDEMTGQIFQTNRFLLESYYGPITQNEVHGRWEGVTVNEWLRRIGENTMTLGDDKYWDETTGFDIEVGTIDMDVDGCTKLCYYLQYLIPPKDKK